MGTNQTVALAQRAAEKSAALARFTEEQVRLLKGTVAKGSTDDELALFIATAEHLGLDPFRPGEIHATRRRSQNDGGDYTERMTIQIGIGGFRKNAYRTGLYAEEQGPFFCGVDEVWKRVWVAKEPPVAAMFKIRRRDKEGWIERVVLWNEMAQWKPGGKFLTYMWDSKGVSMLGKCAEAATLRAAFPSEFAGVYEESEIQVEEPTAVPTVVTDQVTQAETPASKQIAAPVAVVDHELIKKLGLQITAFTDEVSKGAALSEEQLMTIGAACNAAAPKGTSERESLQALYREAERALARRIKVEKVIAKADNGEALLDLEKLAVEAGAVVAWRARWAVVTKGAALPGEVRDPGQEG